MPIYRLIQNAAFGPREIAVMTAGYERALVELAISDRNDPRTETIALRILDSVKNGEMDISRVVQIAIRGFNQPGKSESA
jgi:hypothetical protein